MRLGEKVLKMLEESGRKQNEFANAIGVSTKTVSSWKEENRNPSWNLIVPICRFFGTYPNELLEYGKTIYDIDDRERNLLEHFRALDLDGKAEVETVAKHEHDRVRLEGDNSKTAT